MKQAPQDSTVVSRLAEHIAQLKNCALCPKMVGPVVTHTPVVSKVYLIGQAPGPREGQFGKPFAWTAGKTLFRWFESIGINESDFRARAYMSAVCRCFPGKAAQGGDRVPNQDEITSCSTWMQKEIDLLKPELVIPVGRLAIEQLFGKVQLTEVIGKQFRIRAFNHEFDCIPLPHPSGASTWFKKEPGKSLLFQALNLLSSHPSWTGIVKT